MEHTETLNTLNAAQIQAVTAPFGNLLVLAGAGSGKTRVLVHRIAWLINQQFVSSQAILAVTFTNKAANEMRGRLVSMVGREAQGMWVGTFHGLGHKFLRLHWQEAGLPQNFQVIDSDDQLQIIRRIFKALNINEERWEPKKAQGFINRKKDEGIRAASLPKSQGTYEHVMGDIYHEYEKICRENGLVDFAELLLGSYDLLKNNPDLSAHYQTRFSHFLVDEFQDTNTIQYSWLSILAQAAQSVTVVGDDDQSIYGWRGAKIENIRRFERDYKDTYLVRLEQNYRSTGTILSAANALIAYNGSRMGKTLWTDSEKGELIAVYSAFNEEDEALYVVRQIRAWLEKGGNPGQIGVLYRSNAQSRVLEEAFVRAGIPYTIYGGLRFFERSEIKDALAYLRLCVNVHDKTSFERIINMPPRGIGEKSLEKISEVAELRECSLWNAAKLVVEELLITGKARLGLLSFIETIETLQQAEQDKHPLPKLMELAIYNGGLLRFFKEQKGEKAQSRVENLEELINATHDFEIEVSELELSPLSSFLAYTSLDGGDRKSEQNTEGVRLMTLHSAKGLEFPVVFVCGLEEGLFPHQMCRDNKEALEEERRLCYVGITRAMQRLYLTYAEKRQLFGREEERRVSRFISEIPASLRTEANRRVKVQPFSPHRSFTPTKEIEKEAAGQFGLGQRVRHAKFGEGTILDQEGQGERARVHVHFDTYGSKWLVAVFAKLEEIA
jgi:DNA helicase-2/ATP-dependent DNA helicase PcrA